MKELYLDFKDEYCACSDTQAKIQAIYKFVSRFPTCKVVSKYLYAHENSCILKRKFDDRRDIDLRSYIKKGIDSTDKFGKRQVTCACIAEYLILKNYRLCTDHFAIICWKILADNQDTSKPILSFDEMSLIIQYAMTATDIPTHIWKTHTKSRKPVMKDGKIAIENGAIVYDNRYVCIKVTNKEEFEKKYIDYSKSYADNCRMFENLSHESRKTFDRYMKKFGIEFKVSGKSSDRKSLEDIEIKYGLSVDDWKLPLDVLCNKEVYSSKREGIVKRLDDYMSRPTISRWKKKAMEHYGIKTEKKHLTQEEKREMKMRRIYKQVRKEIPSTQPATSNMIDIVKQSPNPLDVFLRH